MEWQVKKLGEVLDYEQPTKYLVSSTDYKNEYPIPVLTAGKSFLLGNTNEESGIFPKDKLPVIIFDDFTTAIKFVDFPFKVKSSAMKILHAKKSMTDIRFMFYKMLTIKFPHNQHKRYWISECAKIEIPLPPLAAQKQIVERLDKIAEVQKLNDGLIQKTDELFQSLLHKELNPAGKDWGVKRLKEICEINPSKTEINKLPENTVVSFLAMVDVSESAEITNKQERKLNEVKNGFTFFKDGDVLVAKITPCFENGKGAFVENMTNGVGFGSTEFHVLRANQAVLLNKLLYYLVCDKRFRKIGAKFMTGSAGQRRVPKQYLENHKISLPRLEIQKQIVAKLSTVQDYKEQLIEQKLKLKELFDSALAKSMMGDKKSKDA